jgi:prepilin-type N-terminal cleavage/methylation domain-containing protein
MSTFSNTYSKSRGFTFIELMLGMVIVGVVGAVAVPNYVNAAQEAKDDLLWEKSVTVKNTHDILVSQGTAPTVDDLAAGLMGNYKAVAGGLQVELSGQSFVVPTYANAMCTVPTQKLDETVACVGSIAS